MYVIQEKSNTNFAKNIIGGFFLFEAPLDGNSK